MTTAEAIEEVASAVEMLDARVNGGVQAASIETVLHGLNKSRNLVNAFRTNMQSKVHFGNSKLVFEFFQCVFWTL